MINTFINDDCFNIFPRIEDKSINLVFVDLPFGCTDNSWDQPIDLNQMWLHLKRIAKKNANYIFFTTTKFGNELINSNPKWFRYDLVYEKKILLDFYNQKKCH